MDAATYLRFVAALALVVAMIVAAGWLFRRYGGALLGVRAVGRRRRLGVIESLALDGKRRLVLVRRDGVEHVLLVGGGTDVVVEQGIPAPQEDGGGG
ncbi:MAG: FliO/MopB family protein [Magnetospirillum sp.]|nr:FliO/MopB family protein [Magnetospirillum sp.]